MKRIVFALSIISALLLSACGVVPNIPPSTSESYASPQRAIGGGAPLANLPATGSDNAVQAADGSAAVDQTTGAATQDRLVIQTASLALVVNDPAAKMIAIATTAKSMGGYVVSSNMDQTFAPDGTKVPEGSIVVRIPEAKLDDALASIKTDVVDVQSETRSGQDVTKETNDLQSQLTNLKDTEQQLTLIMQKADTTTDVLTVFNQLTQIRGQIDVIQGQIQYNQQSAALSAVTVQLIAEKTIQPIQIAGWQPQGDARNAVQALVNFFQGFVTFLIWLVLFALPAGLLILLPFLLLFLLIRAWVRWTRRNRTKKTTTAE